MERTVVIGGGLGGLAAATLLARGGERVTLVERTGEPGGRARSYRVKGATLNLGPHALYKGGPAWDVLTSLEVPIHGARPSNEGWLDLDGTVHALPGGPRSLWSTTLLDAAGRWELGKALASLLSSPAGTFADWLETIRHPEVRLFLEAVARVSTYSNDPTTVSAAVVLRQIARGTRHGVLYLDGGWQSLVDALVERATEAGVEIVRGHGAAALEGDPVRSVRLDDGRSLEADAVVVALPGAAARSLLGDRAPRDPWAHHPVRAACLDLVLSSLPDPERTLVFGLDRPYYFSVHSRWADFGPHPVVHVAHYLAPHEHGDRKALEAWVEAFQPGWKDRVVASRFFPALVVQSSVIGTGAARPEVDALAPSGIWLAGDWIGNEALLLDGVLASARAAALGLARARGRSAA